MPWIFVFYTKTVCRSIVQDRDTDKVFSSFDGDPSLMLRMTANNTDCRGSSTLAMTRERTMGRCGGSKPAPYEKK